MINYIEEMMKITGVEKYLVTTTDYTKNPINIHIEKLNTPIFTAEKQLEIIKMMDGITIKSDCFIVQDLNLVMYFNGKDFTQALAQLTIELIYLGKLDKNKVKGILER